MSYVTVNGIKMYYEIIGKGEPLLIIWGMGGEIESFVNELKETNKYKLIIFDNRGCGRTDEPDEEYTIDLMAQDVVGLLDVLKIPTVNVLGISMGSRIAIKIASKHPDKVSNLILNVAAAKSAQNFDKNSNEAYNKLMSITKNPNLLKTMGRYPPTQTSFLKLFEALTSFDGTKYLDDIESPTLIVNGTKDSSTPVKYAKELADGIVDSKLILVNEDHFLIRENPELLIEPMNNFIFRKKQSEQY